MLINNVRKASTVVAPTFVTPRAMLSEGSYLYIAQSGQYIAESPVVWRVKVSAAGKITGTASLDLSGILATVDSVRFIAQDETYLYASCWDTGNIALITKSTMAIAGWGYVGAGLRAMGVCVDGTGNFYCNSQYDIHKFSIGACVGQPHSTVAPAITTPLTVLGRTAVRGTDDRVWLTNGGPGGIPPALRVFRTDTLVVQDTIATLGVGGDLTRLTMTTFAAYGSMWTSEAGVNHHTLTPRHVFRTNPGTLALEATIDTFDGGGTGLFPYVTGGSCFTLGPDSAGTADARIYVTNGQDDGRIAAINPADNSSSLITLTADPDISFDGIATVGNFVYLCAFYAQTGTSEIHLSSYNPVTSVFTLDVTP